MQIVLILVTGIAFGWLAALVTQALSGRDIALSMIAGVMGAIAGALLAPQVLASGDGFHTPLSVEGWILAGGLAFIVPALASFARRQAFA
jgi:uncharacterized membrane protein YeaQ/YmgE (transglycosylase-associated protein family)